MSLDVFVANEQDDQLVDSDQLARLAAFVLAAEGIAEPAELSLLLVDEPAIAALNERFLAKAGPTDVLSFPIEDFPNDTHAPASRADAPHTRPAPLLLGDVVICPAVAARNAPEHAGSLEEELALLLVHGILHLLGQDHEQDAAAEAMEARERELLAAFADQKPARS